VTRPKPKKTIDMAAEISFWLFVEGAESGCSQASPTLLWQPRLAWRACTARVELVTGNYPLVVVGDSAEAEKDHRHGGGDFFLAFCRGGRVRVREKDLWQPRLAWRACTARVELVTGNYPLVVPP
jgi:hypothetical protein